MVGRGKDCPLPDGVEQRSRVLRPWDQQTTVTTSEAYRLIRFKTISTGDIPHVFVASAVWDIPVGANRRYQPRGILGALASDWTLTGLLTLQSGIPIAVTQTTNNNAFAGFGTQRPNLTGSPTLASDERTVSRWFNTSAFTTALQFTLGTEHAQSSSRARLQEPRPGPDEADLAARNDDASSSRGGLQPDEHAATRSTERHVRIGGIWNHHNGRRSSRHSTRRQVPLLISTSSAARAPRSSVVFVPFARHGALSAAKPAHRQLMPGIMPWA